jgi:RNA polymerase sigma-70 factor (ECF subfamily)
MDETTADAALLLRYTPIVRRALSRTLRAEQDVPDLVHDVMLLALTRVDRLQSREALKSWLYTTARFVALTRIRQLQRRRQIAELARLSSDGSSKPGDFDAREALRCASHILTQLRATDREVFELRYFGGRRLREISQICDVSLGTVKRRLQRAQQAFLERAEREPTLRRRINGSLQR